MVGICYAVLDLIVVSGPAWIAMGLCKMTRNVNKVEIKAMKRLILIVAACLMTAYFPAQAASLVWGVNPTATGAELMQLNPFTGEVLKTYAAPTGSINANSTEIGLAGWGQNALYYSNSSVSSSKVYVINPGDGSVTNSFDVSGGWEIDGLGFWANAENPDGFLYTSGCSVGDVHRYSATDGSGPTFYWSNVSGPRSMAGDFGGRLFTYGSVDNIWGIWGLDPLVNANATWFAPSPSTSVVGMAYDGEYLYLSDTQKNLYVMDNTGSLVSSINLGYTLYGLGSTEGKGGTVPDSGATVGLVGLALLGLGLLCRYKP